MRIGIALLFSVAAASPAAAQVSDTVARRSSWIQVASSEDARASVNPARISALGEGMVRLWVRWDYASGRLIDGKRASYALDQWEFDCNDQRMKNLRVISYDRDGRVISDYASPYPSWSEVVPDSVGETILLEVCRYAEGSE